MNELGKALDAAASGMRAQSARLRHISENVANSDTPGYRAKSVPFQQMLDEGELTGEVGLGRMQLDQRDLPKVFDPSHPLADESGHYFGSNVDLMVEIADAREAQRSYEANLKMFDQARQMSTSLFDLLRR